MARQKNNTCLSCNRIFRGRKGAKTCSDRCRKQLQRSRAKLAQAAPAAAGPVQEAVAELKQEAQAVEQAGEQAVTEVEALAAATHAAVVPEYATEGGFVGDDSSVATLEEPALAPVYSQAPVKTMPGLTRPGQQIKDFAQPAPTYVQPSAPVQELTFPEAAPATEEVLDPSFEPAPDSNRSGYNFRHPVRGRKFSQPLLTAVIAVLLLAVMLPFVLGFGSKGSDKNTSFSPGSVTTQQLTGQSIQLNLKTVVANGKPLLATGTVNLQNQNDSTNAFSVKTANGGTLLQIDTQNKKVGVGQAPSGDAALQVNGNISTNGQLVSTNGGFSLSNIGLSFNNKLVCSANGCVSSSSPAPTPAFPTIDVANLFYLNKNETISGNETFSGNNTFNGQAVFNSQVQAAAGVESSSYSVNGVAGSNFACSSGDLIQNAVVAGGIITGGTCVPGPGLQSPHCKSRMTLRCRPPSF